MSNKRDNKRPVGGLLGQRDTQLKYGTYIWSLYSN